jgi:long-chain acyl-CoA synthetase
MAGFERSIPQKFFDNAHAHPDLVLFHNKEQGEWRAINWGEAGRIISEIANGLIALGLQIADRVCILSENRLEWLYADLGIISAGGATAAIYPSNLSDEVEYIVNHSDARWIFVSNLSQLRKLESREQRMKNLQKVIMLDRLENYPEDAIGLEQLQELGRNFAQGHPEELRRRIDSLTPDHLLTLIYTSGTTGPPKGVMLTHGNIIWVYHALEEVLGDLLSQDGSDLHLSYLPYAHAMERICGIYFGIFRGIQIAIAEGMDKLTGNIAEMKPTFLLGAPRVYEKIYSGLLKRLDSESSFKRKLFWWAIGKGKEASIYRFNQKPMPWLLKPKFFLANLLVFRKVKERFGGRIKFMVSGAAPIAREILEFFSGLDLMVLESWGMTETSAPATITRPGKLKLGTVGLPLKGVELKLAEDGEILVRGGNVFKGYFKEPEQTREGFESDGFFHSGDIGEMDPDGILKITDRKKDLIITAGGKNIAPQNIENLMKTDKYISEFLAYGDAKKFLVGLVTLDEEAIVAWAKERGIPFQDFAELSRYPEVFKLIQSRIAELNRRLPNYSAIKHFRILPHQFTQEAGELTPTLKLKRKVVNRKYQELLESMYQGLADGEI